MGNPKRHLNKMLKDKNNFKKWIERQYILYGKWEKAESAIRVKQNTWYIWWVLWLEHWGVMRDMR